MEAHQLRAMVGWYGTQQRDIDNLCSQQWPEQVMRGIGAIVEWGHNLSGVTRSFRDHVKIQNLTDCIAELTWLGACLRFERQDEGLWILPGEYGLGDDFALAPCTRLTVCWSDRDGHVVPIGEVLFFGDGMMHGSGCYACDSTTRPIDVNALVDQFFQYLMTSFRPRTHKLVEA